MTLDQLQYDNIVIGILLHWWIRISSNVFAMRLIPLPILQKEIDIRNHVYTDRMLLFG